ncbi:hypothetical protein [Methanopyrus sp.]
MLALFPLTHPFTVTSRSLRNIWRWIKASDVIRVYTDSESLVELLKRPLLRAIRSSLRPPTISWSGPCPEEDLRRVCPGVKRSEHRPFKTSNVLVLFTRTFSLFLRDVGGGTVGVVGFGDLDCLHDYLTELGYPRTFKATSTLMLRRRGVGAKELWKLFPAWAGDEVEPLIRETLKPDVAEGLLEEARSLTSSLGSRVRDLENTPTGRLLLASSQTVWVVRGALSE